jgi:molybdopterin synthase sulfur carrier subunit
MVTFNITGFLTDFTRGQRRIVLRATPATVGEALDELWSLHVGLRDRVLNEQGQVRLHVNVFLNDENIRRKQALNTALVEHCEITILPSVSGGSQH